MLQNSIVRRIANTKHGLELVTTKVNLKISALSRKSGINEETLSKILKGTTKNPGIYAVAKIADALACSVDDLVEKDDYTDIEHHQERLKLELAKSCVVGITDLYLQQKQKFSFDDFLCTFIEVYLHCLNKQLEIIEVEFATLVLNKFLHTCFRTTLIKQNNSKERLTKSLSLKDNLANKIATMGHTFTRKILATRAGVTQDSLSLILLGKTKNPGVYTIAKIAKALDCSIDELLGRDAARTNIEDVCGKQIELKQDLVVNCTTKIIELLERGKIQTSLGKFLHILKNVYGYSLYKRSDTVDADFAGWFIEYSDIEHDIERTTK
jgi:transcriptional regulator with XRE-family HTH domain